MSRTRRGGLRSGGSRSDFPRGRDGGDPVQSADGTRRRRVPLAVPARQSCSHIRRVGGYNPLRIELCRNVKRWSSADMALRWASTMLLYAERRFRRISGHQHMTTFVELIENVDIKEAVA